MMMELQVRCLVAAMGVVLVCGCGDDGSPGGVDRDGGPDGGGVVELASATARFDVPETGSLDFDDAPFPSDLFLGDDGTVDLASLPADVGEEPVHVEMLEMLNARRGFCVTCATYFPVDGALAPESLPASASPGDEAGPGDAIVMIDADPESPDRGSFIPVRVELQAAGARLVVRPVPGVVLHQERRYAVAITNALRARDGTELGASESFRRVRDGEATGRLGAVVGPALDELEAAGVDRGTVVSATLFTTDRVTSDLERVREIVYGWPTPTVVVDEVRLDSDGALDAWFGTPAEDLPGLRVPAAEGEEGPYATHHDHLAAVVLGRVELPRVITGTGTDVGRPLRDASGTLQTGATETVPFALGIPAVTDMSSLPLVISTAQWREMAGLALLNTYAEIGAAGLVFPPLHGGERAVTAEDERNDLRGIPGADGIEEQNGTDSASRAFGTLGVEPGLEGFPGYTLGTLLQWASDLIGLVRLARQGDVSAIQSASSELETLGFDPEGVLLHSIANGSGAAQAAVIPDDGVAAAIFSSPIGGWVDTFAESPQSRTFLELTVLPALGVVGDFDGVERRLGMDPVMDLYRWMLNPADPLALAPYHLSDPIVDGPRPDVLWLTPLHNDARAAAHGHAVAAAAGVPAVGGSDCLPLDEVTPPVSANRTASGSPVTAAAYTLDMHAWSEALWGQQSDYEPTCGVPFTSRDFPFSAMNPVVETNAFLRHVLRTRIETGRMEVPAHEAE